MTTASNSIHNEQKRQETGDTLVLTAIALVNEQLGTPTEEILRIVAIDEATYKGWTDNPETQSQLRNFNKLWLLIQLCSNLSFLLPPTTVFQEDAELQTLLSAGQFDELLKVVIARIAPPRTEGLNAGSIHKTYDDIDLEGFNTKSSIKREPIEVIRVPPDPRFFTENKGL